MENFNINFFCIECKTQLKRQIMDSNVFYYCRKCGRTSSEACLSGEVSMLRAQMPLISAVPSTEISEDFRNAILET
jgi:hypothetical protein